MAHAEQTESRRGAGRVVIALEHRFACVDGRMYTNVFTYERAWRRYLSVFDEVVVLARAENFSTPPAGTVSAEGPNVSFMKVPCFIGPWQFLKMRSEVNRIVRQAAQVGQAFILRVPGTMGTQLWTELRRLGKPYGVEVVGDPAASFAPGAVRSVIRPLARVWFSHLLGKQCAGALAASYVTRFGLQRAYPPGGWTTHYSSVRLGPDDFVSDELLLQRLASCHRPRSQGEPWRIINIGTMAQMYKRQDLLIEAVAGLRMAGLPVELTLVGTGQYLPTLRNRAGELGVEPHVHFTGHLQPGSEIREQLDRSDIFVLSSRQEGLARVVLEAMARGLPVISTDVGGMAEVVEASELVPPDDVAALVAAMRRLFDNRDRLVQLARMNRTKAEDYRDEILFGRAKEFCEQLAARAGACGSPCRPVQRGCDLP